MHRSEILVRAKARRWRAAKHDARSDDARSRKAPSADERSRRFGKGCIGKAGFGKGTCETAVGWSNRGRQSWRKHVNNCGIKYRKHQSRRAAQQVGARARAATEGGRSAPGSQLSVAPVPQTGSLVPPGKSPPVARSPARYRRARPPEIGGQWRRWSSDRGSARFSKPRSRLVGSVLLSVQRPARDPAFHRSSPLPDPVP